jgi:hypothetical protein
VKRRYTRALVALALLLAGCLGTLHHDDASEQVALAPRESFSLIERGNGVYWLLRGLDGWRGSHEVKFGGGPSDPASATVRVVRFRDITTAGAGFDRLTPAYLLAAYRDQMTGMPTAFRFPGALAGDRTATWRYAPKPLGMAAGAYIEGQYTAIQAGVFVILIDSVGVAPDRLAPAVTALVGAARGLGGAAGAGR